MSEIVSVQWQDATRLILRVTKADGRELFVPDDLRNSDRRDVKQWEDDGNTPADPPAPRAASVPETISDRQFFQQLAVEGEITKDEALAAVMVGALPERMSQALDAAVAAGQMTADEEFTAKMLLCGATQFQRSNPYVPLIGMMLGKASADLDQLWTAANQL
jgi:hypothetical protein